MTDKEQIEEMAKVLDEAKEKALITIGSLNYGFGMWYAKALYNVGYHKTIWHKVADGYLPDEMKNVCVVYCWLDILYYGIATYNKRSNKWIDDHNPNKDAKVIAWTELPTYSE